MAATGYSPIVLYNSQVAGHVPSASNLVAGELALNVPDGILYFNQLGSILKLAQLVTPIANGGTGQTSQSAAFNALSPITSIGDMIIGTGTNISARLPIGANTYVLTSNGTTASWQPATGGGGGGTVTSISGTGTVNGITLTGTVTTSGSLTLGGTLSGIANSQLTNSSITINGSSVSLGGSTTVTATATNALTIGTGLSGTSYNGSAPVTIAIASTGVTAGTYGSATAIPLIQVNAQGQITSITTNALNSPSYQGTWNAATNTPTLTSSVGTNNNYYIVSTAGTTTLNGISLWSVGDWAIYNSTTSAWEKVLGGSAESFSSLAVTSLTGYMYANNTGNVIASTTIPNAGLANSSITINGSAISLGGSVSVGTVTSVTGTAPVVSSGGATPAISMPAATTSVSGYLTSTDWNTFNNKGSGTVTSVSFTGGLISVATATTIPALTVAGTSGGVPYFSSASTWASSAALTANALMVGGGTGAAPSTVTTGSGVVTALGVATGSAGAFVVNGGALGTPSSATLTNATGLPLTTGVTGTLQAINGGTGLTTLSAGYIPFGGGGGFTSSGNLTYFSSTLTAPFHIANAGITGSASAGAYSYGTLSYSDLNIIASFVSGTSSYNQIILQNTTNAATASADFVISNNLGSASAYFGDFGMNASSFSGSGSLNLPNAVYLSATTGDLVLGTTTANGIHFVVNSGTSDAGGFSSSGVFSLATALAVGSGGTGVATLTGLVKGNGTSAFTAAVSGTDYAPATSGSAILYGNGSGGFSNVTVGSGLTFSAGTLTATGSGSGTVTSVSFTGGLISVATATTTPALTVAGTSGGVPYFSSASTWASSAALTANALMVGGGTGAAPSTVTTGSGVVTALGVATGSAGAFVVNGGALGTPSSGVGTNLTNVAHSGFVGWQAGIVGGSALTTGQISGFFVVPYSGTIASWNITVNAGTLTFQTWKVASGTSVPTSGNSISTSGVSISTGTAVSSSTLTDFTTTTVTAGDIIAFNISAVSGVTYASGGIVITRSN